MSAAAEFPIFEIPDRICPWCGKNQNRVAGFGPGAGVRPEPGDVAICSDCGAVCIFDSKLNFRKATAAEKLKIVAQLEKMEGNYGDGKPLLM